MFGSTVEFSGTADLMAPFPVRTIEDGGRRHLTKISNGHISATGRPIHSMFGSRGGVFGDGGSNGTISANHMYGQFTCLRRKHHITSLLMSKTLELDFVREGSLGYTVSKQEIKLQLGRLCCTNRVHNYSTVRIYLNMAVLCSIISVFCHSQC